MLGELAYFFVPTTGRVALASFPRSGNTWLRVLLEDITGERTGSIYQDDGIHSRGSEGILIKTHSRDRFRYEKAVHLIRNPYDSLYSYYLYSTNSGATGNRTFEEFLPNAVETLRQHTEHWQKASYERLVIRYEDLSSNPASILEGCLKYLDRVAELSDIQDAVERNEIGRMKEKYKSIDTRVIREGGSNKNMDKYTSKQKQLVRDNLSKSMAEHYSL